jgi:hypothetical protein
MKKIIAIIASVALAVTAIALTSSCQKDINNAKSLVGTTWTATDVEGTYTLTFPSAVEFRITLEGNNWIGEGAFVITGSSSSKLTGCNITLTLEPGIEWIDGSILPISGVFQSESKIYFAEDDMTFTRVLKK